MRSIPLTTCCNVFASTLRTNRTNLFGTAMPVKNKLAKKINKSQHLRCAPIARTFSALPCLYMNVCTYNIVYIVTFLMFVFFNRCQPLRHRYNNKNKKRACHYTYNNISSVSSVSSVSLGFRVQGLGFRVQGGGSSWIQSINDKESKQQTTNY